MAAAVVLVVTGAGELRKDAPVPVATLPMASPTVSAPQEPERPPLGAVISTGMQDSVGEKVFYVVEIDAPGELPNIHFGLIAGHRTPDGRLLSGYLANEFRGSDRSPGFHAVSGGERINDQYLPVYGYFAGPAARITGIVHGETVQARLAGWSEDPQIVVFWFTPVDVPSSAVLSPLTAYTKDGAKLTR